MQLNIAAMLIRPSRPEDAAAIWSIIEPIIRAGETYALDPRRSEADALAYWLGADKETFVAEEGDSILVLPAARSQGRGR